VIPDLVGLLFALACLCTFKFVCDDLIWASLQQPGVTKHERSVQRCALGIWLWWRTQIWVDLIVTTTTRGYRGHRTGVTLKISAKLCIVDVAVITNADLSATPDHLTKLIDVVVQWPGWLHALEMRDVMNIYYCKTQISSIGRIKHHRSNITKHYTYIRHIFFMRWTYIQCFQHTRKSSYTRSCTVHVVRLWPTLISVCA